MKTVRIAISLPEAVLERANRESRRRGTSRSRLFADALTALLDAENDREDVERYLRGYEEHPESPDELPLAASRVSDVWAEEPWE